MTISAENFVDGNEENLLLGFCWQVLRKFQGVPGGDSEKVGAFEQGLLDWCKEVTSSYGLDFSRGFKSESITNGQAFLALLNEVRPGIIDFNTFDPLNKEHNCSTAIQLAEEVINVPAIIEASELANNEASERNIVLYLSLWHNAFKEMLQGDSKEVLQMKMKDLETKIKSLSTENEEMLKKKQTQVDSSVTLSGNVIQVQSKCVEFLSKKQEWETKLGELNEEYSSTKETMEQQISNLRAKIDLSSASSSERQTAIRNQIQDTFGEREKFRSELQKLKEELEKENMEMRLRNSKLKNQIEKEKKLRDQLEMQLMRSQEEQGRQINDLKKLLLKHVHDMHNWKIFLEQDKEYISEDLHIHMEVELDDLSFDEQVLTLDSAIQEENDTLVKLQEERGKKKKDVEYPTQVQTKKVNRVRK
eukprot:TRINITY_DN9968_c0_g1_i3.p1 TRINITY_DN9968_c0_g1~~TRINITY_DN9968_c0_g1_i3.p1  ORF type:complete len:418 (-),score=128.96 TRINITY_DN9968_c0_g1_i3:93-1346(-)